MTDKTPMRERIARAICKDLDVPPSVAIWEDYLDTADAVLDAMREPTDALADAASWRDDEDEDCMYKNIWRAMIDAAKEGK